MAANLDDLAEKRALRLRIGRLRRRVDRRLRAVEREGRLAVSWHAWGRWFPGWAVVAAAGVGLAATALRRERWMQAIGHRLARYFGGQAFAAALAEFRNLWTASAPKKDDAAASPSGEVDHG